MSTQDQHEFHRDKTIFYPADIKIARKAGSRVHFSDGSWCDTDSGEVHNARPARIRMGPIFRILDGPFPTKEACETAARDALRHAQDLAEGERQLRQRLEAQGLCIGDTDPHGGPSPCNMCSTAPNCIYKVRPA